MLRVEVLLMYGLYNRHELCGYCMVIVWLLCGAIQGFFIEVLYMKYSSAKMAVLCHELPLKPLELLEPFLLLLFGTEFVIINM